MRKNKLKPPLRTPVEDAVRKDQSPHWSQNEGEPPTEEIPAALQPHPLVDADLTGQPPATEAAEGVSGKPDPEFEDEPAGQ